MLFVLLDTLSNMVQDNMVQDFKSINVWSVNLNPKNNYEMVSINLASYKCFDVYFLRMFQTHVTSVSSIF